MTQHLSQRIGRVIQEYDLQGWHRTGTAVDADSARWLADWVRSNGLEPVLEPFTLDRIDPVQTYLEVDGQRIEGLPFFESSFTDAAGVRGRLGLLGEDAEVGLAEIAVISDPTDAFTKARHSGNYRALVAITMGGRPGLAPRNAEDFTDPFGPPVLQVDPSIGDWLKERASQGAEARLVAQVERTPSQAFNVVTKVVGLDQSLRPLVVMTPRSGWWSCAAERGGGIVCWLEIMQAVRSDGPMRDVYFLASSGHELGHLGLKAFLHQRPGLARDALTWIHLGASIGAALEPQPRLWNSDDEMEDLVLDAMTQAFTQEGASIPPASPRGEVPGGESRDIHLRNGRYISVAGRHALFHLEADRWPQAIDVPSVSKYATAFSSLAVRLAGEPMKVSA